MAFTSVIIDHNVMGNMRLNIGTYVNDGGSTGGEVRTGLGEVRHFWSQPFGSAVVASASVVDEVFPLSNEFGDVTFVTTANESGQWMAWGL